MINSNIIVKMEMNFALSPKCHFMVMNSISMKMSIEEQPQLEQHQISNEFFQLSKFTFSGLANII